MDVCSKVSKPPKGQALAGAHVCVEAPSSRVHCRRNLQVSMNASVFFAYFFGSKMRCFKFRTIFQYKRAIQAPLPSPCCCSCCVGSSSSSKQQQQQQQRQAAARRRPQRVGSHPAHAWLWECRINGAGGETASFEGERLQSDFTPFAAPLLCSETWRSFPPTLPACCPAATCPTTTNSTTLWTR